nr:hypothetical protein [uncultured Marinifilum sp.]
MSKKRSLDNNLLDSFIYWKTLPNDRILRHLRLIFLRHPMQSGEC